jgi:hypothetical protein
MSETPGPITAGEERVPLDAFYSPTEAELLKMMLGQAGIECWLADEGMGELGLGVAAGGVKVLVLARDLEAAREALAQVPSAQDEPAESPAIETTPEWVLADLGRLAAATGAGEPVPPLLEAGVEARLHRLADGMELPEGRAEQGVLLVALQGGCRVNVEGGPRVLNAPGLLVVRAGGLYRVLGTGEALLLELRTGSF